LYRLFSQPIVAGKLFDVSTGDEKVKLEGKRSAIEELIEVSRHRKDDIDMSDRFSCLGYFTSSSTSSLNMA
jgi:hypothetical protein